MFRDQKHYNRAAGGYKVVDRSHWQRQPGMSRASVNKNISENDHKTREQNFLGLRYTSNIINFHQMP